MSPPYRPGKHSITGMRSPLTRGTAKQCRHNPWTDTADAEFLAYGGWRTYATGAIQSGKSTLSADWGAFHDTNARAAAPSGTRIGLRAVDCRYTRARLGRDPGTDAGTALRGGVRAARSRARHPAAGLGCGSGLALLMAASRGARGHRRGHRPPSGWRWRVSGCCPTARSADAAPAHRARLHDDGLPARRRPRDGAPVRPDHRLRADRLRAPVTPRGWCGCSPRRCRWPDAGRAVVLAGWGPPERCATSPVLRVAARLADPPPPRRGGWRPTLRDDLEDVAARAGLRPDGSGRVACPFGYADAGQRGARAAVDRAVRRRRYGPPTAAGGEGGDGGAAPVPAARTARCGCRTSSATWCARRALTEPRHHSAKRA